MPGFCNQMSIKSHQSILQLKKISYPKKSVPSRVWREQGHGLPIAIDQGEEFWQLGHRTGPSSRVCEVSSSKAPSSITSPSYQIASYSISILQLYFIDLNTYMLKRKAKSNWTGRSAPGNQRIGYKEVAYIGWQNN